MRLTWHDAAATALVGAAVTVETLHVTGNDLPGLSSPRAVTGAVLLLGVAGFATGAVNMASLAAPYARWMSFLGCAAVITGLAGLISSADSMAIAVTVAVAAMWVSATVRRLVRPPLVTDAGLRELIEQEQRIRPHS